MARDSLVEYGRRGLRDMRVAAKQSSAQDRTTRYKETLAECIPRLGETAKSGEWSSCDDKLLADMLEQGVSDAHEIRAIRLRGVATLPKPMLASDSLRQRLEGERSVCGRSARSGYL